jgi:serine/threonine-protein kinase
MSLDRWQRVKEIYNSALDLEPGRREAYLAKACGGDESMRQEVEALLANLPEAERFMKDPAMEVAARGLARDRAGEPSPDYVGRSLLQYRLVEKIGEGGMGVVGHHGTFPWRTETRNGPSASRAALLDRR